MMTSSKVDALTKTALLAAGLLTAGLVQAQSMGSGAASGGQPQGGYPSQTPEQVQVDDATLETFAEAFQKVQQLNQELTEEMASVESTEAAQSMQREAQAAMVEAVENSGISITDYNDIASGMRNDPVLAERVKEAVGELR